MNTLKIKNMVCDRCIMTVRQMLDNLGHDVESITLGRVEITDDISAEELRKVDEQLRNKGFELIKENGKVLIEEIKTELINYLEHIQEHDEPKKLSEYLSGQLHYNYSYLSNQFSEQEELTIEQYFIHLKIERVKELLTYEEMTLSEIAWKLNYSSVQYLSNQFKKVTGETVSSFRKHLDNRNRQSLDTI